MTSEKKLRDEWLSLGDKHQGIDLLNDKMDFLFRNLLEIRDIIRAVYNQGVSNSQLYLKYDKD